MHKLILALAFLSTLAACNRNDEYWDDESAKNCNSPVPTSFASNESATSLKVNFVGGTVGACSGVQIPLVISGTYAIQGYMNNSFNFTTNPADTSITRRWVSINNGSSEVCSGYNTLDCSNFAFSIQDETTGATVGDVTSSCNLILFNNVGHRTVVKARNKQSTAFWPDSAMPVTVPVNILTCN